MHNDSSSTGTLVFYLGTDSNKVVVVQSNESLSELEWIQTIHPVAPNPLALKEGVYNGVATEWVSRHPKLPLVYALTSYWNSQEACVTTFRIKENGALEQLGEHASTGGFQAAHGTFSSNASLYAIAHHNDGRLAFFDSSHQGALQKPIMVLETPEIIPGTRRHTKRRDAYPGLPSLHHVQYSPNGQYLLTVDPSQDHIFTYSVDERGLPNSLVPIFQFKCYSEYPIYGWFQRLITKYVLKCKRRTRKVAVHPNGKYIYILYESINRLQVYSINDSGRIDSDNPDCWQDTSTLDPSFCSTASLWRPVGLTLQSAAELQVSRDGRTLFVSNRGDPKMPGSRSESSVRVFAIGQDGRLLKPMGALSDVREPVRHFVLLANDTKLVAGVSTSLQVHGGTAGPVSSASPRIAKVDVGAKIFCISY